MRVIDLATVVAGPGAPAYLADFGADVVKIERPGAGDSTRTMGLPDPRDGTSPIGRWWARNKRCATLDLKSDEGRDALLGLVEDAHVLVENFRPGVLERLGLGPDVLLARNPGWWSAGSRRSARTGPTPTARGSPRWPRPCRASPPSTASPTAGRCCRPSP